MRISKGVTVSPGIRYTTQNVSGWPSEWEPRFGLTYAPKPGGKTTLRASAGIFHRPMQMSTYEQSLRVDGVRTSGADDRELFLYPIPGTAGAHGRRRKQI